MTRALADRGPRPGSARQVGPWTLFGRAFVVLFYEGRTLFSLDGVRANHLLQRRRLDVTASLSKRLGLGATGELFSRRSYYQDPARTRREYRYPEFRVYLAWTLG